MDHIEQTTAVLARIVRHGGAIEESSLPHQNVLVMHRLTQRDFIKEVVEYENSERVYAITDKGVAELERHYARPGH